MHFKPELFNVLSTFSNLIFSKSYTPNLYIMKKEATIDMQRLTTEYGDNYLRAIVG